MKGKELLYLLGLRPRTKTYGYQVETHPAEGGTVEFATWQHPKRRPYSIEQKEMNFLRSFIRPGDCAIDIGAATGDTALPIGLACGPTGTVLAFEPNCYVYKVLEANSRLNSGKVNIIPFNYAVTEQEGDYVFEYSDAGYSNGGLHEGISVWRHGHAFPLDVKGIVLGSLLERDYPQVLEKLRYIKIDVEGYDLNVMKSIRGVLAAKRPYIRSEVYKWLSAEKRRQTLRFLSELGYTVHALDENWEWGAALTEDRMFRDRNFDIFAVPS
jgi:FkbM family methyltransferase